VSDFQPKEFSNGEKRVTVFRGLCKGCGLCIERCPVKAISWSKDLGVYSTPSVDIDLNKCISCKVCEVNCPDFAVKVEKK
jgi:2-oxoglutarate ferredoxin oxidoreductase subunit delta